MKRRYETAIQTNRTLTSHQHSMNTVMTFDVGARVAQGLRSWDYLATHTTLSPIRVGSRPAL